VEIAIAARGAGGWFVREHMLAQAVPVARSSTRLLGMWGVSVPHAMLPASLPEGKCSLRLCGQGQGLLFNMGFHPIPHTWLSG